MNPNFSGKGKGFCKGGTASGMSMGVPSDTLWPSSNPSSSQTDNGWRTIRKGEGKGIGMK